MIKIPTYDASTDLWSYTEFSSREDLLEFLKPLFKEPGQYNFDVTSHKFNEQARIFNRNRTYCIAPPRSKDYVLYWDTEKEKCRAGVIFKSNGNTWYITRDYYMWLNFLPIYNKEVGRFTFADVRDAQYHMALYEDIARLSNKHAAILKKRQIASSYFHAAKMINGFWFEEGWVNKIAASLKDYINEKGTWRFLDEYKNFLNTHTAWYRPCQPDKTFNWEQKIETTQGGRKKDVGLKSVMIGVTLEKDPTNGVGGPCLEPGTLIRMFDGSLKPVEQINIGDYVSGADGKPKKVTQLFTGISDMYTVHQSKGISYTVTADHTLYLYNTESKKHIKVKAKDFNSLSHNRKYLSKGIKFNGLNTDELDLPIDPYYLGLYLGDGCKYDYTILVNLDKDPEIAEYISDLNNKENHQLKFKIKNKYRDDYQCTMVEMSLGVGKSRQENILEKSYKHRFNALNLSHKHIPNLYFKASQQQRLELIAGILDTDGYYNLKKNRYELTLHSDKLANDFINICILSGLDARSHLIYQSGITSVSKKDSVGIRINITGDLTKIPCKILRKKASKNGLKNCNRHSTIKVEFSHIGLYYGFECEDHLFILEDGTITHNCNLFFHEEAGIAPRMNETLEYLLPALKSGMIYTGMFVAAGSVGDLDQCEPLRDLIFNPDSKDVLAVPTNLVNDNGDFGECGLFIPEQWSMLPCIDEYGNSLVENALDMIIEERKKWKKDLKANDYQLRISQKPINIEEAFAYRKSSVWPLHLITSQLRRIEDKEYYCESVDLIHNDKGEIEQKPTKKLPIMEFPLSPKTENKEGAILIWEKPVADAPFGTYYASVDPVGEGKSTTSDSLCSIFIYKSPLQVTKHKHDGTIENHIETDKIVASWCGRFDDITKTHERLEILIEYYKAWTIVENNVSLFIQHMIHKKKQKYLVPKSQILFLKDLGSNNNVFQEYGWRNTGTLFKGHLINYGINFLTEEIDVATKEDGTIVKTTYGVERIPDPILLKEMQQYREGLNVDRLVAFCALVAFAKVQQSNRGLAHKVEKETNPGKNSQKSSNLSKLSMSPFRNLGKPVAKNGPKFTRQAFRNIK